MTFYSVALTTSLQVQACQHLLRADRQEDLCFALWYPSRGRERLSALLHSLVLPRAGERIVRGHVSFLPHYFERALGAALEAGAGLALLHSHLAPGWQGMSPDDVAAESGVAPAGKAATGLPLLGLTLGADGAWSARFWKKCALWQYERQWCHTVRVVGDPLQVTYHDELMPIPRFRRELERTVSAWGPVVQAQLARLHIGIVGAGSVGSIVAETLARMGVAHIRLLDFDTVENVNLDRLLHATRRDAELGRAKVQVLAEALRDSATAESFVVEPWEWSVVAEEGYRAALDCDVLFSCVDRPWPRHVLNFIAYAHLIPVVDGGIRAEQTKGGRRLRRGDWRAHVAAPGRTCLECLGQYQSEFVSAEREGYLDDATYIAGLPNDHLFRCNENVFPFSLSVASLELLQFLALCGVHGGLTNPGAQIYHFVTATLEPDPRICNPQCLFLDYIARGDSTNVVVTGRHVAAEQARAQRQSKSKNN